MPQRHDSEQTSRAEAMVEFFRDRKDSAAACGGELGLPHGQGQAMTDAAAEIMVVEDDPIVRRTVVDALSRSGHSVTAFGDGAEALQALRSRLPEALIVDRMLPGASGDEICRYVRSVSELPIIMLTALGAVEHRIAGLEHGADDYVAKPFSLRELQLRLNSLLRRSSPSAAAFVAGSFHLDPLRRSVRRDGAQIQLTSRELELLVHLARHPGEVLSRDELLRQVWGWDVGDPSTVTVHVRRLREKIEPEPRFPRYLLTCWGQGYRFDPQGRG